MLMKYGRLIRRVQSDQLVISSFITMQIILWHFPMPIVFYFTGARWISVLKGQ